MADDIHMIGGGVLSLSPVVKAAAPPAADPEQVQAPQGKPSEADRQAAGTALELAPPYDLAGLGQLARSSSALRPCIAAYATLKSGFGYQLKPVLDLEGAGANDRLREAIVADNLIRETLAERGGQAYEEQPSDDAAVALLRATIERQMAIEKVRLERFLRYCAIDRPLTQLRKETTQEQEAEGMAYWEVLRRNNGDNGVLDGEPAYFKPLQASTMRLRQIDSDIVQWKRRERVSLLSWDDVEIPWRFRGYVQRVHGMDTTYFREYGDPRPRGARTGRVYESMEALRAANEPLASEIIHWRVFDPDTPYGVPRWISAEYSVGGIQEAERVNYYYFDGRAIPPGILAVSGGKLRTGAAEKVETILRERAAGRAAFYSMLVMEAEGASAEGARCRIEWIPLTDGSERDGRFLDYQRLEAVKVQQQFRLPDIITGRSQEVNRAQIDGALRFAEQLVIQPLREDEDGFWNHRILGDGLGIKWWEFKTNSAVASDPVQLMALIAQAVTAGMVPSEARGFMGDVFNKKLDPLDAPWTKQPLPLTLAGILPVEAAPAAVGAPSATPLTPAAGLAGQLQKARDALRGDAHAGANADAQKVRRDAAQTFTVDIETWKTLVEQP